MQQDVIVIGAGVVGLAIARKLAIAGYSTIIVDRHESFGQETSSRNSEVIHAGIYYPAGSLKALFCVNGKNSIYEYCDLRGVPFSRCGKLIVACGTAGEEGLMKIVRGAESNGVHDLIRLDSAAILNLEPSITADFGLLSPSTGIIDSHKLMLSLLVDFEEAGGIFVPKAEVEKVTQEQSGFAVYLKGETEKVGCRNIINAAGLNSGEVAEKIEGLTESFVPKINYARGVYFGLANAAKPFKHLIYPLPDSASLGIHATIDLAGQVRFGPDVDWIEDCSDYSVDPMRAALFAHSVQSFWPHAATQEFVPLYAGIRPKLAGPQQPAADFRIDGPLDHGIEGLVCLHGIESPGLTSSLEIANFVHKLLS